MIRRVSLDGRADLGGPFQPIDRPRVFERLERAAQYRIALVIAPAGFGKSVAIRQYLKTVPSSVVYDVPSDATTLVPFVRGFADAIQDLTPGMRRSLATALEGARLSDTPGRDLAAWAATHLRALDTVIAIDDLHVGEQDPEISRFVERLIERTRDGPRWLLSSRTPLQLPVASWFAYGESDSYVDFVDLRFSIDEARQSAAATRTLVRDEELAAILELVEGWPTALTFALRTSTRASDLRAVSAGTREMVYRYLAEQVWNGLDARIQSFLKAVVFLPRLDVRIAVAAGFDDAAAIIQTLRERVAFISPIEAGSYRLHDLFRDFVVHQLQFEGDAALREARLRSAHVLESVGLYGSALERFADARSAEDVKRLIATQHFRLLEAGQYDVVERALRVLPGGEDLRHPAVLAMRAALEEEYGRVQQAEKWYVQAIGSAYDGLDFQVALASRYALMLYQQGRLDGIPILEELHARADLSIEARAQVAGLLGTLIASTGKIDKARAAIDEALRLAESADDLIRARTHGRAGTVAYYARDNDALEYHVREATRLATECGAFALVARFYSTLSSQHYAEGRLPTAAWYAAQVASNAEKGGDRAVRARGLRELLALEAERGNEPRVHEIERDLADLNYQGPAGLIGYVSGRATAMMWRKHFAEAQNLLASIAERDLLRYQLRQRAALLAVAAGARDDRKTASAALDAYANAVEHDDETQSAFARSRGFSERYAILANILIGRNAVAARLARAVRVRRPDLEPFDAVLAAALNRAPERLEEALRDMRAAGQAGNARLIQSVLEARVAEEPDDGTILTAVERQVLRAMASGLSNQAIADEQRRTVNTVRTHVSSILRKFGCDSRGEAVAIARRQNLV